MGEAAIYFEENPRITRPTCGDRTLSIQSGSELSKRISFCIDIASDSAKLPLFAVCKSVPGKKVETYLSSITHASVITCVHKSA